ncbi:MAG: replicative DNA helicase [Anaerovoracaceae bacterium]|nr:replicative DNA helicase [Bacillota bacterium]MDD7734707.1 replicative DNA helicase [Bacillota bacterium]MDY5905393.1 replicative DNA helicase [Anaerovoracaceae bacterium]
MNERIPPHSIEAEKSVLGSVLQSKEALFEVLEILEPEDFYSEHHKEVFEAVRELNRRSEPVDILTVSEELKKRNTLAMVGGRAFVASLPTEAPSTANAESYAHIIKEKAILRSLIQASADILDRSYKDKTDSQEVLSFAEQEIFNIARAKQKKDYTSLYDVMMENISQIDAMASTEGKLIGLTTGFVDLDEKTAGLQKSNLIIIAARPAMGKTAFVLNLAQNAALKADAKVLIFSLEMSKEELGMRMLSSDTCIDLAKLKTGDLNRGEWEDLYIGIDRLTKAGIYIDDTPGISLMEMKNKCRRLKAEKGLDLVIVDYLQLMEAKAESRQQEISKLSRSLKILAKEMDCPVIVLSQLSRAVEQRIEKKPQLSDLRESGAIEQDADLVMFLYRDEYYNPDTDKPNTCEVILAKHRGGSTGTVELAWLGKYTKFADKSPMKL